MNEVKILTKVELLNVLSENREAIKSYGVKAWVFSAHLVRKLIQKKAM
jgi:hypothetical protein